MLEKQIDEGFEDIDDSISLLDAPLSDPEHHNTAACLTDSDSEEEETEVCN